MKLGADFARNATIFLYKTAQHTTKAYYLLTLHLANRCCNTLLWAICLNICTLVSTTWINENENLCSIRQLCLDNKIFIDVIFNINEKYIDKEIL